MFLHINTASVSPLLQTYECILFSCFLGKKLSLGGDKLEDMWPQTPGTVPFEWVKQINGINGPISKTDKNGTTK